MSSTDPASLVRFGTSSFANRDWVGPFYPTGTRPADYLREYSRRYDTVEVDASYYAVPTPSTVDGWDEKTPDGFLLCAKFPRSIVHAGKGPAPDPRRLLDPEHCAPDRDAFLGVMSRLGPKLGTLLLQFPYFNRCAFDSAGPFLERLDAFLSDLPPGFSYAVEIRNRQWLGPEFLNLLRHHRVDLAVVDQAWMPHGDELEASYDLVTGSRIYLRLLGDHKAIEELTTTWDKEVVDRRERLDRWAGFLVRTVRRGVEVLVFVNNHYAGHAPATTERLKEMFRVQLESSG